MPTRYLDPNADVTGKTDWTASAGTDVSCVDDAVRQPTAPNLTDYISTSGAAQSSYFDFSTFTIPAGETITSVTAWAYVNTTSDPTDKFNFQLADNSRAASASGGVPFGEGNLADVDNGTYYVDSNVSGWISITYTGSLTQAQLDALQVRFISIADPLGTLTVYATYIEVVTGYGSYSDAVLGASQLALYWPLQESASVGVATDLSGNGRGGVATGRTAGTIAWGATGLVPNDGIAPARSLQLARSGYVHDSSGLIASGYKPYVGSAPRSFECVFLLDNNSGAGTLFAGDGVGTNIASTQADHPTQEIFGDDQGRGWLRYYRKVRSFPLGWVDSPAPPGAFGPNGPRPINPNRIHHYVLTYDDGTGQGEVWIDGRSNGRFGAGYLADAATSYYVDSPAASPGYLPGNMTFGFRGVASAWYFNAENFTGYVAHIAVYHRILTATEIQSHAAMALARAPVTPVAGR